MNQRKIQFIIVMLHMFLILANILFFVLVIGKKICFYSS